MWSSYANTSRWSTWAPQIRRVEPLGALETGMRGKVEGPFWTTARFEVTAVDEAAGLWTWRVQVGPARLTIDHEVADGLAAVEIDGPPPLVYAYAPVARIALARLVRVEG
jgi:hypothetical protein